MTNRSTPRPRHGNGRTLIVVESRGVRRTLLADTGTVRVWRWQCTADLHGQTDELRDRWQVVSLTHAGSFLVHAGEGSQMIDATRAVVIPPGERFRMTRCNDSVASGSALSILPDAVPGHLELTLGSAIPDNAFLLQHLLLRRAGAGANVREIDEAALWLLSQAAGAAARQARGRGREAINDVQFLLARRFREAVPLDEIARSARRSPYHLSRAFKRETGLPPHHYITRLRLRASLGAVVDEESSLAALAHSLGYSSHSHFSAAFRDEFRVTPTELRRIARLPYLSEMRRALNLK